MIAQLEEDLIASNLETNKYREEARRRTDQTIELQFAVAR